MPKNDKGLCLYVNYCGLNRIIIKNRYSLLLIGELIDWLADVYYFFKIDIHDVYY